MKKILCILAVVALLVAMAVPCFASVSTSLGTFPTEYRRSGNVFDFKTEYIDNKSEHPDLTYVILYDISWSRYVLYCTNYGFEVDTSFPVLRVKGGNTYDYFSLYDSSDELAPAPYVGLYWGYQGSTSGAVDLDKFDIIWASDDIYNALNGTLFLEGDENFPFPPTPLEEEIRVVTEETLTKETLPMVVGTMKTLVLCGVGLMALLVVLSLFGKRSLIFRS